MTTRETLQPAECPQTCNAPVCPLDPVPTVHLGGEPVCYYLRNSGKPGAGERFTEDPVFAACLARLPEISTQYPDIDRAVERAAKTGFLGGHLVRTATPQGMVDGTFEASDIGVRAAT